MVLLNLLLIGEAHDLPEAIWESLNHEFIIWSDEHMS